MAGKTSMEAAVAQLLDIRFHRGQSVQELKIHAPMISTIEGLKAELMDQIDVPVEQQAWFYENQRMENGQLLTLYLPNESGDIALTVHVYEE